MIEIARELIEKPENLRRYVLYLLEVTISIIIATRLYKYLFGAFEPILIGDKTFWNDSYTFIISGNILIVAAVFFFVKYVILELISIITFLILNLIPKMIKTKSDPIGDNSYLKFIFKNLGILKFGNEKGKMPQPGRNFQIALNFVDSVNKDELHNEVLEIKRTSIFEFFNLYVASTIVYYFILDAFHHPMIDIIIIIGFILLIVVLISIEYVFFVIDSDYEDFSKSLKLINLIHITENFIRENNFTLLEESKLAKLSPYINEVKINDVSYYIGYYFGGSRITKWLRQLEEENSSRKILLVTNERINKSISNFFNKDLVNVIRFKNEEKFVKRLEEYFF